MKGKSFIWVCVGVIFLLVFTSFALARDAWVPDPPNRNVPGELIVGFKPGATLTQINSAISSIGGSIKAKFSASRGRIVRVKLPSTDPTALEEAMERLRKDPLFKDVIRYVEPNVIRKAFGERTPNGGVAGILSQGSDRLLGGQWGYYDIGANWINAPASSSGGVTVAVIDTGVDYTHPDLLKKVTKGKDFANADSDPMDDHGHGTHVAGIIAANANNGYGIVGVSWNAKILAIKALDSNGIGNDFDIALAIYSAASNGSVKVINMSLGGPYSVTEDDAVYEAVVVKGKLLVAAAGNGNTNSTSNSYPAAFSTVYPGRVLAVAAHDTNQCKASFSNYGSWISITAPGVDILSTLPTSIYYWGFDYWQGTSMAAPFVSGAAALAWEKNPSLTNVEISNLITTKNAGIHDPLLRNGTCWPNDGSTFQRLNVVHMLEMQFYEACNNKGGIQGYAFDAETGLPLAGAKVTIQQGSTTTGIDYVPYFGYHSNPLSDDILDTGYGLFNVLASSGSSTLTITKSKYMKFTPKDQSGLPVPISVPVCGGRYAGNIPVPPNKPNYWVIVTWEPGYSGTYYDLFSNVWDKYGNYLGTIGPWTIAYSGNLNTIPYMKHFWDSDLWLGDGDLGKYAESIRISKNLQGGEYIFYVDDWWTGDNSTNWDDSKIKAYIFKGNQLIKTYTPPAGSGRYWVICGIIGSTIYDLNYLTN